jgi:Tfp pilus assembly major pilin PilA
MTKSQQRIWTIYCFILILCVPIIIYTSLTFDNIELETVITWIKVYFVIPIILIVTTLTIYIYKKYFKQNTDDNGLFPITKAKLNTLAMLTYSIFIVSSILIATAHSSIVLTNAYCDENKNIKVEAKIINSYSRQFKGYSLKYIVFKDANTDKTVELKVNGNYQPGQTFKANLLLGKWGLMYSKK